MKKIMFGLSMILMLSFTACGDNGANGESAVSNNAGSGLPDTIKEVMVKEAVEDDMLYFAELLDITTDYMGDYLGMRVSGEEIAYGSQGSIIYHALADGEKRVQELKWDGQEDEWSISQLAFGADGSVYASVGVRAKPSYLRYLCKFSADGQLVYSTELTDYLAEVGENMSSEWDLEADAEGRTYLSGQSFVWLFGSDGSYAGSVDLGDSSGYSIIGLGKTANGKICVSYESDAAEDAFYVAEIDFAGKKVINLQKTISVNGVVPTAEGTFAWDNNTVYQYDRAALTMTPDFNWQDCNVEGDMLQRLEWLSDGRMVAVTFGGVDGAVYVIEGMTKAQAEEKGLVSNKVEIVIGTISDDMFLKALKSAMATFNRESDKYKVVTVNYREDGADRDAAFNRLNSELVSGKGPDILDFGDFEAFAKNGAVENLYEYLEKSEMLSKEDFFENQLAEYDEDGILTAIPREFQLDTIIASSKVVGEEMGWTLDEMIALGEQYPDKQLYYEKAMNKRGMLIYFIRFYGEQFLDWENATCNFDTEEFRTLLKFMEQFPDDYTLPGENDPSIYTRLASGEVLTTKVLFTDFRRIQPYEEALGGDLTFIGFPTPEGAGCWLSDYDAMAINSNSQCKEGAWAFLEFFLTYDYEGEGISAFPSYIPLYEKYLEESMTDTRSGMMHQNDGWSFKYHTTTQEEADKLRALVENAQYTTLDVDMVNIIVEEAASYFSGQKPMDTVIEIIQNRVQNYMEENL